MNDLDILLVEDSDDDAELTLMAFRDAQIGNPVVRLRDGAEALEYLFGRGSHASRARPRLPAVILLDLKLPRIDGIQVLQELRARHATQHVPVVMLTSSVDDHDRIAAYRSHVNSYIRKPTDYDDLVSTTRQLGLYWTVINVPAPESSHD